MLKLRHKTFAKLHTGLHYSLRCKHFLQFHFLFNTGINNISLPLFSKTYFVQNLSVKMEGKSNYSVLVSTLMLI